jgi:pimeloyl-ACP methyl ester carboxylesterase
LASQYPDIISQLVLVDSAGFVTPAIKKNLMGVVAKIIKPIFKPRFMQGLRKKIYKGLGAEDYLTFPELKATFLKVVNEDLSKDMKGIKIPTLIITGEDDKDTPIAFGKRMNFLIPNSQLLILKNAGHYSFLDQPEEFVKILAKFI